MNKQWFSFFLSLDVSGFWHGFSDTVMSGITLQQYSWLFLVASRRLLQCSPSHPTQDRKKGRGMLHYCVNCSLSGKPKLFLDPLQQALLCPMGQNFIS